MKIHFTCRHTTLTPTLRAFAEDRIERLARYVDDSSEVHIVLSVEKHRQEAEIMLLSGRRQFTGTAITSDLYTSLSLVLDKIQKQLRRDKRRYTDRRRRSTRAVRERLLASNSRDGRGRGRPPSPIYREPQAAKPMSPEEAALDLDCSERDFLVFRNSESDRMTVVYRRQDGRIGLIEAD